MGAITRLCRKCGFSYGQGMPCDCPGRKVFNFVECPMCGVSHDAKANHDCKKAIPDKRG